jgi:hypothetical protein
VERRGCWRGEERGRARRLKRWIEDCEGRTGLAMQKLPVNDLALGRVRRCRLRGQWENRCARRPCVHSCASQQVVLVVRHAQSTFADRILRPVTCAALSCRAMGMGMDMGIAMATAWHGNGTGTPRLCRRIASTADKRAIGMEGVGLGTVSRPQAPSPQALKPMLNRQNSIIHPARGCRARCCTRHDRHTESKNP